MENSKNYSYQDGSKINYLDVGTGPVILFGHSYLWDGRMWESQIEELSKNYRCIVPDLWGHGKSGGLPESYNNLSDLAHAYHRFMQSLEIEEYSVVGLSVGGMWGAHLASLYKKEVQSLIIMDSYLGAEEEEAKQQYFDLINAFEGGVSKELADRVAPFFFRSENPDPELLKMCEDRLMEFDKDTQIPHIMKMGHIIFGREDGLGILVDLKKSKTPMKIMVGEYDIPRPPSEAREMAELIGDKPVLIENSGHIPTVENPEHTNSVLGEALASMLAVHEEL